MVWIAWARKPNCWITRANKQMTRAPLPHPISRKKVVTKIIFAAWTKIRSSESDSHKNQPSLTFTPAALFFQINYDRRTFGIDQYSSDKKRVYADIVYCKLGVPTIFWRSDSELAPGSRLFRGPEPGPPGTQVPGYPDNILPGLPSSSGSHKKKIGRTSTTYSWENCKRKMVQALHANAGSFQHFTRSLNERCELKFFLVGGSTQNRLSHAVAHHPGKYVKCFSSSVVDLKWTHRQNSPWSEVRLQ